MRAADLATEYPTVTLATPILEAARLLAGQNLPGLIVVDDHGLPITVLPGTQVLRLAVPSYIQDDPTLAAVIDEAHADVFMGQLAGRTVADALPREWRELPVVDPDDTVLEIAALMARTRSPLVAVVDQGNDLMRSTGWTSVPAGRRDEGGGTMSDCVDLQPCRLGPFCLDRDHQ